MVLDLEPQHIQSLYKQFGFKNNITPAAQESEFWIEDPSNNPTGLSNKIGSNGWTALEGLSPSIIPSGLSLKASKPLKQTEMADTGLF